MWQGQRNDLRSAARLTAQPRWGHSAEKATTASFAPFGWRISQTEPTGSRGYRTQASTPGGTLPASTQIVAPCAR